MLLLYVCFYVWACLRVCLFVSVSLPCLFLLFQVLEPGCIIRRVEYQADDDRGFQVIKTGGIHYLLFIIICHFFLKPLICSQVLFQTVTRWLSVRMIAGHQTCNQSASHSYESFTYFHFLPYNFMNLFNSFRAIQLNLEVNVCVCVEGEGVVEVKCVFDA